MSKLRNYPILVIPLILVLFAASTLLYFSIKKHIRRSNNYQTPIPTLAISPIITSSPISKNGCIIGGCSGELCLDESNKDIVSICIYKEEYACYKTAKCERQSNGKCGWTQTEELKHCLSESQSQGKETPEGKFCGGIAGLRCPEGYECKLDGNYPDAGGVCAKI